MKDQLKKIFSQQGLTFIEALVALAVLITAIISVLTLATYNLNIATASENRLKAANFAREAIEVIRQIRDSNWLAGNPDIPWYSGILDDPDNYRLITKFDPATNSWSTTDQTVGINDCAECTIYFDDSTGVYSHNPGGAQTPFKRLVTINEICWQQGGGGEITKAAGQHCSDLPGNDLIGYQLKVEVSWHDNNRDHLLNIIDRLYDWR